ncbi:hypothetical protein [Sporomusa sp. KB1]|uniref:hypothetical protein n=1 Tax=Sporomusa sp. KB1 TaxID=943346 RepID=UPI00119FEEF6|nr:hypothetical protein [Sporomusa sp. KB1]TWH51994.1 hypothetical protein Salpa_0495 [Sporomusa sp. KB1]
MKMKKQKILICMLALVLMLANAFVGLAQSIEGTWIYENEQAGRSFSIKIWLEGDTLYGSHSAAARQGARIDSSEGEISLKGVRQKNAREGSEYYLVKWQSSYSDASGDAWIIFRDGTARWQIDDTFQEGEHYFPQEALLQRQE